MLPFASINGSRNSNIINPNPQESSITIVSLSKIRLEILPFPSVTIIESRIGGLLSAYNVIISGKVSGSLILYISVFIPHIL